MLEVIREYAAERLQQRLETAAIQAGHARHYLEVVREADELLAGPDQTEWLKRLATEQDNLRAALAWAIESGEDELAVELVAAAGWFWFMRGP